jgi:hypothetical protein
MLLDKEYIQIDEVLYEVLSSMMCRGVEIATIIEVVEEGE